MSVGVVLHLQSLQWCLHGGGHGKHVGWRERPTLAVTSLGLPGRWPCLTFTSLPPPLHPGGIFSLPTLLLLVMDYGKEEQNPLRGSPAFELRKFSSERLHLLAFSV